ncbi:hypothetical protein MY4824_003052 [Beauveria thailandica]
MTVSNRSKFPKDPILVKLLQASQLTTEQIIHDAYGFNKTYGELLSDIFVTRDTLQRTLPPSTLTAAGLLRQERPYIGAITCGGYEFIVAFFAIRALGGACFPFGTEFTLTQNIKSALELTFALLAGERTVNLARDIAKFVNKEWSHEFVSLQVSTNAPPTSTATVSIDESLELDSAGPGVVLCTSGTTGIPKATVLPRQCLVQSRPPTLGEATLSYRPPHWRGGFASLIQPPISGMKLYSLEQRAPAPVVWETLRKHHITNLVFNPVLLRAMKDDYTDRLSSLPSHEKEAYVTGFKNLERLRCSGAFLAPSLLNFWTDLTELPLKNAYGCTECGGGVTEVNVRIPSNVKYSVGQIVTDPPTSIKFSQGTHGEFRVKSPWMMIKYIENEEATKAAFDDEGYYKTGDLGHVVGDKYVFEGRANDDCKCSFLVEVTIFDADKGIVIVKVPRLLVELAISSLPYISEAYVLRVPDHQERAVCGAIVRVKADKVDPGKQGPLSLGKLHADLTGTLPAYMRPYLLRVLNDDEHIPLTDSQKPNKPVMLKQLFGVTDFWNADKPTPGVQVWPMRLATSSNPNSTNVQPWDFEGLQGSM